MRSSLFCAFIAFCYCKNSSKIPRRVCATRDSAWQIVSPILSDFAEKSLIFPAISACFEGVTEHRRVENEKWNFFIFVAEKVPVIFMVCGTMCSIRHTANAEILRGGARTQNIRKILQRYFAFCIFGKMIPNCSARLLQFVSCVFNIIGHGCKPRKLRLNPRDNFALHRHRRKRYRKLPEYAAGNRGKCCTRPHFSDYTLHSPHIPKQPFCR